MEFCQLGDLSYFIKRRDQLARTPHTADMMKKYPNPPVGGLHEVIVRHFLQQLASALEFLRNRNLIHRDVKPQNLLLNPSPMYYSKARPEMMPFTPNENSLIPVAGIESLPMLKIADFGFARSLPSTSLAETLCGSPLYMAPEILRYEKYDAKADLWSVGAVLYEMMTGKPPFGAANHVELLRKIEKGEDRIRFSEDVVVSDSMKKLIRGLLRRNPVERMGFNDFFDNTVVKDDIPGLVGEDRPLKPAEQQLEHPLAEEVAGHGPSTLEGRLEQGGNQARRELIDTSSNTSSRQPSRGPRAAEVSLEPTSTSRASKNIAKPDIPGRRVTADDSDVAEIYHDAQERAQKPRRPSMVSHATAPARPDLYAAPVAKNTTAATMHRQPGRNSPSPSFAGPKDPNVVRERVVKRPENRASRELREAQERAAQDVAFERDYVVVEKRAVEVNAFADELAASPKIHVPQGASPLSQNPQHPVIGRRNTTQSTPSSTVGANVTPSRAIQLASGGRRPDHQRQTSYERRSRTSSSASSAISKAINLASGRLFSFGITPPLGIGRGGASPPTYSPFPAYPTSQGSMIMIGDGSKAGVAFDEDTKALHVIEESATRSDVVYGFAEVKYKQLIPIAPSVDHGLGLRQAGIPEQDESQTRAEADSGLTVDATVALAEEALVLYVKALLLLAKCMDIAGVWWARKSRGEVIETSGSPKTYPSSAQSVLVGNRVNNVVQWVRGRFNEVLEKAEFVRLKLIEAQKRLPEDHPSHPNNIVLGSTSATGMGTSADNVVVSPGVTAEKLMYLRALEMSRSAAVNELVCEDLPGCEIAYITAIRMLEAVLENDDEPKPKATAVAEKDPNGTHAQDDDFNPVNPDDRESVLKRTYSVPIVGYLMYVADMAAVVQGIRGRLDSLRKKLRMMSKRSSTVPTTTTPSKTLVTTQVSQPAVLGTSPR